MSPGQQIAAARELISEAGNEIVESILLKNGHYIGRKFRFDGGHAIWECGEPQLSIFGQDGTLVKRIALMLEQRQAAEAVLGYGLTLATVYQDLAQLRASFNNDWETIINACSAVTAFGFRNMGMAEEWADITGLSPEKLLGMDWNEAMLLMNGTARIVQRPDYLRDKQYEGLFQPNPRFAMKVDETDRTI